MYPCRDPAAFFSFTRSASGYLISLYLKIGITINQQSKEPFSMISSSLVSEPILDLLVPRLPRVCCSTALFVFQASWLHFVSQSFELFARRGGTSDTQRTET